MALLRRPRQEPILEKFISIVGFTGNRTRDLHKPMPIVQTVRTLRSCNNNKARHIYTDYLGFKVRQILYYEYQGNESDTGALSRTPIPFERERLTFWRNIYFSKLTKTTLFEAFTNLHTLDASSK